MVLNKRSFASLATITRKLKGIKTRHFTNLFVFSIYIYIYIYISTTDTPEARARLTIYNDVTQRTHHYGDIAETFTITEPRNSR